MNDMLREIKEKIQDSDIVLVGLGEKFQYGWDKLIADTRYQEIETEIDGREEYIWVIPFLQKMVLNQNEDERLKDAYLTLKELIDGKNYFIVSLCMDDYIYRYGFQENRVVTPCGGFRKMQCDVNCDGSLWDVPVEIYHKVEQYYKKEITLDMLQEPICEKCGQKLRFNQLGVTKYAEQGYLDIWAEYTKWLQGTVNRKLCVLELGVGLEYPSVIRFPFEKIVFYNQKAFLYRVHPFLYQLGEEIAEKGKGIKDDPVDFLQKAFVN